MRHKIIESTQNPLIKRLFQLKEKSRARRQEGVFLIEGKREIGLALEGGYLLDAFLYCPSIFPEEALNGLMVGDTQYIEVSKEVYQKLAHRDGTEGLLAVAKAKSNTLQDIFLSENPLVLVAEAPEKPGNIGALLRTADAANLDAVIIANPKTDFYNPNIIRSSVGTLFTNQVASGTTAEVIDFLRAKGIDLYCAALTASQPYHELDYQNPTAIVVGTEANGLSDLWLNNSKHNVIIPMQGKIDSMNVSVSAAILIFEAKRQRGF